MNALPAATALQIRECDLVPKASTRRDWWSYRPAQVKQEATKPRLRMVWLQPDNVPLADETPAQFVRRRCIEMNLCVKSVCSESKLRMFTEPRQKLMAEVRVAFPKMSFPAIAKVFGKKDHQTVIHACRKHGIGLMPKHELKYHREAVCELYRKGLTKRDIGRELGFSGEAVCAFIRREGITR